jgi:hypothetical protein
MKKFILKLFHFSYQRADLVLAPLDAYTVLFLDLDDVCIQIFPYERLKVKVRNVK